MPKGGLLILGGAVLACSACLNDGGKLEIRSVESGLKAGREPVPFRIAEARSHLALGNVALALEGFRKASREDPTSIEALAGIADCYDRIRRYDLSRRHYERALALAPRDPHLLAAFAGSLDQQGNRQEAASVRQQLASLVQPQGELASASVLEAAAGPASEPATPANDGQTLAMPAEQAASTVAQAPPPLVAPAPVGQSVTIALPPPRPVETAVAAPTAPTAMAVAPVGRSVTIALPPPRPVQPAKTESPAVAAKEVRRQPRIERVSMTEVALFTADRPRWRKPVIASARMAAVKPVELRILNAARVDRLAARTRTYLGQFGWRQVMIGDAAQVRSRSLIVYPAGSRAAASKLSSRFGFAMASRKDVRQVTILLGRDAAGHPALQRKS